MQHIKTAPIVTGSIITGNLRVSAQPRRKQIKCFTLERGPRTGQFNLTVTQGLKDRRYEINSRRYDLLVRLANSGNYYIEIYDADYGVAWMIRSKTV